jgi:hypothetical protein
MLLFPNEKTRAKQTFFFSMNENDLVASSAFALAFLLPLDVCTKYCPSFGLYQSAQIGRIFAQIK